MLTGAVKKRNPTINHPVGPYFRCWNNQIWPCPLILWHALGRFTSVERMSARFNYSMLICLFLLRSWGLCLFIIRNASGVIRVRDQIKQRPSDICFTVLLIIGDVYCRTLPWEGFNPRFAVCEDLTTDQYYCDFSASLDGPINVHLPSRHTKRHDYIRAPQRSALAYVTPCIVSWIIRQPINWSLMSGGDFL